MKSKLSKLLHPILGRPMILHVLSRVQELRPSLCAVVVGYQRDNVINALEDKQVEFVIQDQQLGTAHAVGRFLDQYPDVKGTLIVLNGDTPLISTNLLQQLIDVHDAQGAAITLITSVVEDPTGYGRIVRRPDKHVQKIVEEADADPQERAIKEVNSGIYAFDVEWLRKLLPQVQTDNKQKEYYLPDVVPAALKANLLVAPLAASAEEVIGINTRAEMAVAEQILQRRINHKWMLKGVTMHSPDSIRIDMDVEMATDVVLYPNVCLEGTTLIGADVTIHQNCRITDSYIDGECVIYDNCVVESSRIASGVKVGPFARLRPNTYLAPGVRIGNFVELKNSSVGEGSKANHLSYIGDATIGGDVNIGAGTITCNYDGEKKHPTTIEDRVFIGSDTQLIAPVKIGKGAYVAAGSSITEDVPPGSLAIARGRQVNKEGWVSKKKKKE